MITTMTTKARRNAKTIMTLILIRASIVHAGLLGLEVPALRHPRRDDADVAVVAICAEVVTEVMTVPAWPKRIQAGSGIWL